MDLALFNHLMWTLTATFGICISLAVVALVNRRGLIAALCALTACGALAAMNVLVLLALSKVGS
jgi:hypothetical protein